jgi:hypothetical protein
MNDKRPEEIFHELRDEKDKLMMSVLFGQESDFTRLREIGRQFEEWNQTGVLVVDGTDEELWQSVTEFFRTLDY